MPDETSAGAVVFRKDGETKYLLLQYRAGHWDFPKGNIEKGEEEKETAAREIKEETGIAEISFAEGFKERIKYFYRREGRLISKEVVFYLIETKQKEVKISFEHIGYEWLNFADALAKVTFKNSKEILKKANEFLISKTKFI
ncbi:NUDIX domain-containing protein [Candidatus Woesearchaeota archaeon]|nr:NUDIX domain-containing protein [Candidatus Woesearchaeota archaeon]